MPEVLSGLKCQKRQQLLNKDGTPNGLPVDLHVIDLHKGLDDRCLCGEVTARELYTPAEIEHIERGV